MGIIITDGVVAPQEVYAPLSKTASQCLKISLPYPLQLFLECSFPQREALASFHPFLAALFCGHFYRLDNLHISGATAEIACNSCSDVVFGRIRILI